MSESISQGIPYLELDKEQNIRLYKCNDITFTSLKKEGFNCKSSKKKPDQLVASGLEKKQVLIAIEDKLENNKIDDAVKQIKDNYLSALPNTRFFIARAGERVKVLYRLSDKLLIELNTLKRGHQVLCFGPKVITGENDEVSYNLQLLSKLILVNKIPDQVAHEIEIDPPAEYFNPLAEKNIIKGLWQKIFVCTGEQAHSCLNTFVELLVYKGVSDANILPEDYKITTLMKEDKQDSLGTYIRVVRPYINDTLFPCMPGQPGVINKDLFAFSGQETTFKTVLKDLNSLGNLAQQQLDPDFKRKVLETFLGSSNREGKIKNGQHLTPRNIVQAIWRMANPEEGSKIIDPACGVGGFVLEGLNYPFEFNPSTYTCLGIDRSKEMITLAKANMVLHLLDKIANNPTDLPTISGIIHRTFLYTDKNGTGTLGELIKMPKGENEFKVKHNADYIFANVPFFSSGVAEIDKSLEEIGGLDKFYESSGLGIQSRFLKYILEQIQNGDPGLAFVIVPDGVLKNASENTRTMIKEKADMLAIISLPIGTFENNNWKTSLLIFQKKTTVNEHAKVMLYNVENIGVSLDKFRAPIESDDLITMELAWKQRMAGESSDEKCAFVSRAEFNDSKKWSDLFNVFNKDEDETISFNDSVSKLQSIKSEIGKDIESTNDSLGNLFTFENSTYIGLADEEYFKVYAPSFKPTISYAKHNKGEYPLYSSQISGPVEYMTSDIKPILYQNEENEKQDVLISWNIKGDAAKDVRLHNTPFYGTENRGIIEVINDEIDIEYVQVYLKESLVSMGKFDRANEAHVGKVRSLKVKLPIDDDGNIDINKQRNIVNGYKEIVRFKERIKDRIEEMLTTLNNINVMK